MYEYAFFCKENSKTGIEKKRFDTALMVLANILNRGMDVGDGVKVGGVYEDNKEDMKMVYDPSHPDADENGYVTYPNVNIVTEMTNMIDSSRAYEANATAFSASKAMAMKGLEIGKS